MSPGVPSPRVAPLPRTRSLRPFCVPGGTFTVTGKPLMVGTRTSAPNAASGTVTGMVMVTLSPLRPNTACSFTWTTTYRSPFGPPFSPGAPLPLMRTFCPSFTPPGMRVWIVRVLLPRPLPLHVGHGSSTTSPRPRHSLHGSDNEKPPKLVLSCPVPVHLGHIRGEVPALAPVPLQVGHGASLANWKECVTPSAASRKVSVASVSTSAPRRLRVVAPPRPRPPNSPPNKSLRRSPPGAPPWPNRSLMSNPPAPVPPPPGRYPPPKSERASSYSLRRLSSDRTL